MIEMEWKGDAITNMTKRRGIIGWFPHLLQYTSKSLALWLQMLGDSRPS